MNMRQFLGLLVFTLCGITSFLLSSGLPAGTPILQNNILVPIESLQIGTTITGYNPEDNSYPETKILDLLPHEGSILVEIKTKHGSIFAAPDQLFYDVHGGEFKKSAELSATSMLLDKELRQIQCHGIEIHENSPTTFCELSLEEPHLFFSSDQKILMHNAGMAIATAGEKAAPFVAKMLGNAAIIGCVYISGVLEKYYDLYQGKAAGQQKIESFVRSTMGTNQKLGENYSQFISNPPLLGGISLDPKAYADVKSHPSFYSPFIIVAEMNSNGTVRCTLRAMQFFYVRGDTTFYNWRDIGHDTFQPDHDLVRNFIFAEDRQQLEKLRSFMQTWPAGLTSKFFQSKEGMAHETQTIGLNGKFEKQIYGKVFSMHAIHGMVTKNIPPSKVLQTIAKKDYFTGPWPGRHRYVDAKADIVALTQGAKILAVGRYSQDFNAFNEAPPEDQDKEQDGDELEKNKNPKGNRNDPNPYDKRAGTRKHFEKQSTEELLKSKKSMEKVIREHNQKLGDYKNNPDAHDNKGLLKNVSQEIRELRISTRKQEINRQIYEQNERLAVIKEILNTR